jgi:hypothetical protein
MAKIRKSLKKRRYPRTFAIEEAAASAPPAGSSSPFDTAIEQQLVPYDENLLERARTQWQFGDWDSLAKLERDTLQHHPDRAKLALLAAAGHLRTGVLQRACVTRPIGTAMRWGQTLSFPWPVCPVRAIFISAAARLLIFLNSRWRSRLRSMLFRRKPSN